MTSLSPDNLCFGVPQVPGALGAWLVAHGYEVRPHYLRKTAIQLGWQFTQRGFELSWRCEGRRVWIVMLRRCSGRVGLTNPFAAFYVLAAAVLSVFGEGFSLYGNVQTLADSPLHAAKLSRF
jgi:type III secretion system regulator LcrR